MPVDYPLSLRTIIRAKKSRSQPATFSMSTPRRGYAYVEPIGTDVPVFWDVGFLFTPLEAAYFQLWFVNDIARGVDEFNLPIRTEFGLVTYTVRFLPDSLLQVRENGELFEYTATIMARAQVIPAEYASAYPSGFVGTIPDQTFRTSASASVPLAGFFTGGVSPISYYIASGSLPFGITLNVATGELTGTATTAGQVTTVSVGRLTALGATEASNVFTCRVTTGVLPTLRSIGSISAYPFQTTINWPSPVSIGDVGFAVIQYPAGATASTPTGWAHVPGSPFSDGSSTVRLHVFWHRCTSTSPPVCSLQNLGNVQGGQIFVFSGCMPTGNPWDQIATTNTSTAGTAITFPAVTTTVQNCRLLFIEARFATNISPNLYGSYVSTSGAITSITEAAEMGQLSGTGQGGVVAHGALAIAGASGTMTAVRGASNTCVTVTIALFG